MNFGWITLDLITTQDWTVQDLEMILQKAKELKKNRIISDELKGKTFVMIFYNPSTRTRNSFAIAMTELGGFPLFFEAQRMWLGQQSESPKDTAKVISRYASGLGIRIFPNITKWQYGASHQIVQELAKWADIPLINLEDDMYHPCQALSDIFTIREKKKNLAGKKFVLSWAYHPKPLPVSVPNSTVLTMTRFGLDVTLLHPTKFELDKKILTSAKKNAKESGGSFEIVNSLEDGYRDADIVYVKSWGSLKEYGNFPAEKKIRAPYRGKWTIDEAKMELTKTDSIFMHCLPIRRNIVVTDDVVDGPHSIVYDQAENRLHVQKAILLSLLK
ncbi:MAG: N-acetylornithine carbamoyltransferase [Candidatus Helarchaeota archaeon]|nr:N-acetylornithine carbamoyltransferase [Candidatus Helarchaeota archaeon]